MEKTYMDDIDRTIFPYVEYPGYPFRYPTHLPLVIEKKQADLLRRVSAALYAIFAKAVRRFQSQSDEFFDEMEIPKKMRRYLHEGNAMKDLPSWLSRFDYVMDQSGRIQMVEINADTPCAEIEAYYANGVAARYFFKEDPNEGEWDRLRSWMKDIFLRCTGGKSREELLAHPVLFSCFDDYVEDLGTTRFLMQAMQDAIDPSMRDTIVFESFYHLAVMEDGSLALPDGRTVSFLYRMHPMEILIEETADQDASSLGELLMDGYKAGKFHMMNPPESLIMQSKGFQALIYALMEKSPSFFTEKEKEIIRTYLPESYFQRDFRLGDMPEDSLWIRKPIWGREGRGIEIINGRGETIYRKKIDSDDYVVARDSDSNLVQRCVPQQKIITKTDVGIMEGYVTLSCFMLGDTPSALYARFSDERIAGNEAYWIPVLY